jgi:hypothetical protein
MNDKTRGIYHKYNVTRTDGSSEPGGKHENCAYFVLDCTHDPHALKALQAYLESCRIEYPFLARDLECMLDECQIFQKEHAQGKEASGE